MADSVHSTVASIPTARAALAGLRVAIFDKPLKHEPQVAALLMHGIHCYEICSDGSAQYHLGDNIWEPLPSPGYDAVLSHVQARILARTAPANAVAA